MPEVYAEITWSNDERRLVLVGKLDKKAMDFLLEQLQDKKRETINLVGIQLTSLQVGPDHEDPKEQCERARVTDSPSDVTNEVADIADIPGDDKPPMPPWERATKFRSSLPPSDDEGVLDFRMPFGKYGPKNYPPSGLTLFEIAEENPLYLDWCVDNLDEGPATEKIKEAVKHPDIARRIDSALESR